MLVTVMMMMTMMMMDADDADDDDDDADDDGDDADDADDQGKVSNGEREDLVRELRRELGLGGGGGEPAGRGKSLQVLFRMPKFQ